MARFYFQPDHWTATFEEHDGIAPDELEQARQAAADAAREFLHTEAAKGRPCGCCSVDVMAVPDSPTLAVLPPKAADLSGS